MKLEHLPDFAKPYKTRGYDVRLVYGRYQLFRITSRRVPDKKYPQTVQTYLGTIDPEKGFIPVGGKKGFSGTMIEFGLSDFIITRFGRRLAKSTFNGRNSDVYPAVVLYLYGHLEERFARLTWAGQRIDDLPAVLNRSLKTIKALSRRIGEYMEELIPDRSDRDYLEARLRELRVSASDPAPGVKYPADIEEILEKYGVGRTKN